MNYVQKRQEIIEILKTIFDPELPVNIWDLGLINGIDIKNNSEVIIIMTLTSPNCPAIDILPQQVEDTVIGNLDWVFTTEVDLTFDPAWSESNLSEEIRLELGLL